MLSAAYISAILGTRLPGPGAIYLSQSLRFRRPVKVGDWIVELAASWAMFRIARADGLFIAWGSIAQTMLGRTCSNTPLASFSSSRESNASAEAEAPKHLPEIFATA